MVLIIFCLISNIQITIGVFPFYISFYAFFWYLIYDFTGVKNVMLTQAKFLWLELALMTIVGGVLLFSPWFDPYAYDRTPTQRQPLRTLVGVIRTMEAYAIFWVAYYQVVKFKISGNSILRYASISLFINLVLGYLDPIIFQNSIRLFIAPNHYALERFTGLQGEPRGISQLSINFFILIVSLIQKKEKWPILGLISATIMIFLSFSTSGFVYFLIIIFIYSVLSRISLKHLFIGIMALILGVTSLLSNEEFVERQVIKLARVQLEEEDQEIANVPDWINRFETFDQSALAFYYFNPQHLFLGVGPNTISIPSSAYMSPLAMSVLGVNQNNSPVNGIVYILSRTGLIGLFLYFLYFIPKLIWVKKIDKRLFVLLFLTIIYYCLYRSLTFFYVFGIVCAWADQKKYENSNSVSK